MARKRYPGGRHRKNSETVKYQAEKLIEDDVDSNVSDNSTKTINDYAGKNSFGECEDCVRSKKGKKCTHSCAEICCKYNHNDCNFICDSERELLIRIICLLINEEYGLKAIEQKIKKSELNDDIKNITSITDLLERAIVGLGETALGAVKKAVDAAGTMSDITSGLAKIAAGAAGTAGAAAFTAQGLANVASGTAGTAGAAAHTVSGLTNTAAGTVGAVAAGAATAGAAADVAAEAAGLVAASAATVGVAGDVAAEAAGLAVASAATVGAAGDIAAEAAGLAAASAATVGEAGDIAAEAAGLAAASAATVGEAGDIAAEAVGLAAASAATVGAAGDIAAEAAGLAAAAADIATAATSITSSVAETTANKAAATAAVSGTVSGVAGTVEAISSTTASAAETVANVTATTAATSGTASGVAGTVTGAADTTTAIASTSASAVETVADTVATTAVSFIPTVTVPIELSNEAEVIQVCVFNNKNNLSSAITVIMNNLNANSKSCCYEQNFTVPSASAVFLTITSVPGKYEVHIDGLSNDICAYCVVINKASDILNLQTPIEAKVLYSFPHSGT